MILSSFDSYSYNIRLDNDNSNNIYINFNISKIIIEFETKTEVFYKIFFINKDKIFFNNVNNNEHDFLNIDYKLQYFLNNIKTIFVNKNLLSELIINYLIMSDDELEIYCLNSFKNKKLLLLFLFYMHNEI
tara:strand:+ start:3119 stop:3511 length:393 start_codon:yes stop_codon:yes gene_type:complete